MALSELKQTEEDIREYGVQSAPDKLTGSAAENKAIFDRLFRNASRPKFNALIDALMDGTAAQEIGIQAVSGLQGVETLQGALERFAELLVEMSQGSVADNSITEKKLANEAVTTAKLANGAVTGEKVANEAIKTENLATHAVKTEKVADGAITTEKIAGKAVTEEKLADMSVTAAKLAAAAVTAAKIGNGAVTKSKLGEDVTAAALGGAVPSVAKTATLASGSWSGQKQTVGVLGVTAANHVIVTPHPDSFIAWADSMVRATAQGEGTLTFACENVPEGEIKANVLIVG